MRKRCIFSKTELILVLALVASYLSMGMPTALAKEPVVLKVWSHYDPGCTETIRFMTQDLKQLGIEMNIKNGTYTEWTAEVIGGKPNPYHLVLIAWTQSPDRTDPEFFLTEFFHSSRAIPGGRNYGYYINREYDKIVEAQQEEMDSRKRQKLVWKAQELLHKDNAIFPVVSKPLIQVYNAERLEGVIPVKGSCIGMPYSPWTFLKAKPRANVREVRVVRTAELDSINPFITASAETQWWLRLTYDTFLKRDQNDEIIGWVAESWRTVDSKTVDIVLREGMTFHDGKPVTVEDAKFTFDYIKKWKFPLYARVWQNIDSVTIMDGRRVRFKLVKPYAPFVTNVLLDQFILPKHVWEKIPESVGINNPMDWSNPMPLIGSGPYQFVEDKKGEYAHLKAHKKHWMAPNFDGMWIIVTPTIGGMLAMLEKGEADIMGWYVDPKSGEQLAALPHLKMASAEGAGRYELRPNFKMKPMSDPKFRQAFQHTINRKGINEVIYGGRGTACPNTPIPEFNKYWNNPNVPVIEFDLGKARKILEMAGYTWDKEGRLCYPE